ncbi:Innexin-6 [Armadillidium vulgare]|nr:Innexin-6 [Armadillidium vulgare]
MSVFSLVGPARLLKKYKPRVDNFPFRLCYRVTVVIFFVSSVLVTAREFVGKPIQCEAKNKEIKGELINTYCYIMSTFKWNKTIGNIAYPGTGTYNEEDSEFVFHTYYLWVPFVLVFQGISFYLPYFLWKKFDGGVYFGVIEGLPTEGIISLKNAEPKIKV